MPLYETSGITNAGCSHYLIFCLLVPVVVSCRIGSEPWFL